MNAIKRQTEHPRCERTGMILPLSKSLASQDLAQHRAMVAVELEVLAKKFDRYGWERERGTAAHDRQIQDWMEVLQDYPLEEVQAACRAAVCANPNKMPNEGHVRAEIQKARARSAEPRIRSQRPQETRTQEPRVTAEQANQILREAGFPAIRRMPGIGDRSEQ